VKYAFIEKNECDVPVTKQCRWLEVSTSGYYDWKARKDKELGERKRRQKEIDQTVSMAFIKRHGRYGSPRLTLDLCEAGFCVAENTVAAIANYTAVRCHTLGGAPTTRLNSRLKPDLVLNPHA
jgi:hypothetical protein